MIGVDYDLFWRLNPKTLKPFIKAFSLRQQYDDTLIWTQGKYIQLAIASTLDKKAKYPTVPFSQIVETPEDRMLAIKERFMVQAELINSRFEK